jgi:hypothetical protein
MDDPLVDTATTTPGVTTAATFMEDAATANLGGTGSGGGDQPPLLPLLPLLVGTPTIGLPKNYLEYFTLRRDLDPPVEGVMDMFKADTPWADSLADVRTYAKLNTKIIDTKDSNHGYPKIVSLQVVRSL